MLGLSPTPLPRERGKNKYDQPVTPFLSWEKGARGMRQKEVR